MSPPGAQAMQNGDAAANGSTGIEAYTDSFVDRIFGTRTYTPGAALQKPRKVPLRIEPKTWFGSPGRDAANERTFLSWMSMATTLGGVSTALMGFTAEEVDPAVKPTGPVSPRLTGLITCCLSPIAILMIAYALFIYLQRTRQLKKKLMGFYQDFWGPVVLCVLVMLVLTIIMVVGFIDVIAYK